MTGWKARLKADPIDWLLEDDNPSVAYLARRDLLDEPDSSARLRKSRAAIMSRGVVPAILDRQADGCWNKPGWHYLNKYKGTVWQLMILAEHCADGHDSRIRSACEHIFDNAQDKESGGFSVSRSARQGGGRHSEVIPCLTGNMVWSLVRLGHLDDPRVEAGIRWITTYQRFDDAIANPPRGWPYEKFEMCWGGHTCHMAVVKALKALSEIPAGRRCADVSRTIAKGVEFILEHHVFKKSHDLAKVAKPGWRRFQFPLMYQTDVLEVAEILANLGCRDHRVDEAIALIESKQDAKGRWTLENTFNGRFQVNIETKGRPSKWITLKALRVLKQRYEN